MGVLNTSDTEFVVAVPESIQLAGPSSSIEIRLIRGSHNGYDIYGAKPKEPSSGEDSIHINLTAPLSTGTYDIYFTVMPLSGLEPTGFKRLIGEYRMGDLVFLLRESIRVT
jgi:hypothetical protein